MMAEKHDPCGVESAMGLAVIERLENIVLLGGLGFDKTMTANNIADAVSASGRAARFTTA